MTEFWTDPMGSVPDNLPPKDYGMRECPDCEGEGWLWERIRYQYSDKPTKYRERRVGCKACNGEGRIRL